MRASKLLQLVVLVLSAVASPAVALAEEVRIGFVDIDRALNETDEAKRILGRLKSLLDGKQREFDGKQRELMKLGEDIEKQRTLLKQEELMRRAREFEQKRETLARTFAQAQQELNERQMDARGRMLGKIERIAAKISAQDGFTMILSRSQALGMISSPVVIWARPHLDITNEVIRRYNRNEGGPGIDASTLGSPGGGGGGGGGAPKAPAKAPAKGRGK